MLDIATFPTVSKGGKIYFSIQLQFIIILYYVLNMEYLSFKSALLE